MHKRRSTMAESHKIIPINSNKIDGKKSSLNKNFVEEINIDNNDFFECDLDEI